VGNEPGNEGGFKNTAPGRSGTSDINASGGVEGTTEKQNDGKCKGGASGRGQKLEKEWRKILRRNAPAAAAPKKGT
jgi:hypothetical protein